MISYETAKELKEAGFPQKEEVHVGGYDIYYQPTLSELIEWCGDKFEVLRQYETGKWFAAAYMDDGAGNRLEVAGWPTPESAVARLGIAIYKTKAD